LKLQPGEYEVLVRDERFGWGVGADVAIAGPSDDMLALDEALQPFEREQPRKAELVKLRYFAGLSETEAAAALGISRPTAARWWAFARAWLYDRLHGA